MSTNTAPSFSALDGHPAGYKGGSPVILDNDATIADAELDALGNYAGATLTLARHGDANPDDEFSATGSLALAGDVVSVDGTAVGSYTNAGGALAITFNADATPERVDSVLRQIAYRNTSANPPATAQIDWTFSDGNSGAQGIGGPLSATGGTTVEIYDNPPAFTGLDGAPSYTENGAPVVLDADVTVSDLDLDAAGNYAGATLTLIRPGGAYDNDRFTGSGTLSLDLGWVVVDGVNVGYYGWGSVEDISVAITFNENATPALVNRVLQQIAYRNDSDVPPDSTRIDWTFDDGHNGLATGSTTVAVTAVNDAPELNVFNGLAITDLGSGGSAQSVVSLGNGNILAAGDSGGNFAVVRYHADGSLDTAFGNGGKVVTDFGGEFDYARSVTALSGGAVVAAGVSNGAFALARYNSDGSLDTSFDGDGKLTTDFGGNEGAQEAVALADGKILVAGGTGGSFSDFALVRYHADGSPDAGFGSGGKITTSFGSHDSANSVTVLADGRILAAGSSEYDFALARYNADGSLDTSFDSDGKLITPFDGNVAASASVMKVLAEGDILAAGFVREYNDGGPDNYNFAVAHYHADGSLDASFGNGGKVIVDFGGDDEVKTIELLPGGDILLAGTSDGNLAMARLNADGTLDGSFGTNGKFVEEFGGSGDHAAAVAVSVDGDTWWRGDPAMATSIMSTSAWPATTPTARRTAHSVPPFLRRAVRR